MRRSVWFTALVVVLSVLIAGCGGGDQEGAPTGETTEPVATTGDIPQEVETTSGGMPVGEAAGHHLYIEAGCNGCHGEHAEGTEIAPALPGHSEEVVIRQVRSPLDEMPVYSVAELSDEDLHEIAQYVASLERAETHVEPVELSDLVATHHWVALSAIEAGDLKDALHHVDHIIKLVQGEHLAAMDKAREHLEAGDAHEAEHLIEGMLAGTSDPALSPAEIYLRLALAAVENGEIGEAIHETRHYVVLGRGHDKEHGREVLAALRRGELHEAEHGLDHLAGESGQG